MNDIEELQHAYIHTYAHKPSDNNKQKNVANNKLPMKQTQAIFTQPFTEAKCTVNGKL